MASSDKIFTKEQLGAIINTWKQEGEIVFTNGCFDILHIGHVDYLEKSKALGSRLIVGLNTDSSIRRIKGPKRPVTDEQARGRVMAALECVDAVILFNEDTPYDLIQYIKPDILIKGDDYTVENIVGADIVLRNGGVVKTVPLVKGYSTTDIILKIKNL